MAFSIGQTLDKKFKDTFTPSTKVYGDGTGVSSIGIGETSFVFDVSNETTLDVQSKITDHFVEDNTVIQDHIALMPIRYSLKGFIGELLNEGVGAIDEALNTVTEKLGIVDSFFPELTTGVNQKLLNAKQNVTNKISFFDNAIAQGTDIFNLIAGTETAKSKQGKAVQLLTTAWQSRSFVTLTTPYSFYDNMVIEQVTAIQVRDNKYISDIEVKLKQIRTAQVNVLEFVDLNRITGRANAQSSSFVDNGRAQGEIIPQSQVESTLSKGISSLIN